jgi:hypothetical protein
MSIRPFHKGEEIGPGLLTRIIKEGLTREESLKLLQEPEPIKISMQTSLDNHPRLFIRDKVTLLCA